MIGNVRGSVFGAAFEIFAPYYHPVEVSNDVGRRYRVSAETNWLGGSVTVKTEEVNSDGSFGPSITMTLPREQWADQRISVD
jgi:hypothetical protein